MQISHQFTRSLLALLAVLVAASAALARSGPPATHVINDQKAGSALVYNYVTSAPFNACPSPPCASWQETRISMTNTHQNTSVSVNLFFVDGATCSVTHSSVCLLPDQPASFLASDIAPNVTGYIIAVAVDRFGVPINFNYLIGDESVKLASHAGAFEHPEPGRRQFNLVDHQPHRRQPGLSRRQDRDALRGSLQ